VHDGWHLAAEAKHVWTQLPGKRNLRIEVPPASGRGGVCGCGAMWLARVAFNVCMSERICRRWQVGWARNNGNAARQKLHLTCRGRAVQGWQHDFPRAGKLPRPIGGVALLRNAESRPAGRR
jgi:hypothetical protein